MKHQAQTKSYKIRQESRKFVRRVLDFENMLESLGITKESFYRVLDPDTDFFKCFTFDLPVCLWAHDANRNVLFGNRLFTELFGKAGRKCFDCMMNEEGTCECCVSDTTLQTKKTQNCRLCKRGERGCEINVTHIPMTTQTGSRVVLVTSFYVKEPTAIFEQFYLKKQQKTEANEVYVVACAACQRIRNSDGEWVAIDSHVLQAFNGKISHGLCIECSKTLYPEIDFSLHSDSTLP